MGGGGEVKQLISTSLMRSSYCLRFSLLPRRSYDSLGAIGLQNNPYIEKCPLNTNV